MDQKIGIIVYGNRYGSHVEEINIQNLSTYAKTIPLATIYYPVC
jgi:hypothetical protein